MNELEHFLTNAAQNSVGYGVTLQDLMGINNIDISYRNTDVKAQCAQGTEEHGRLNEMNQHVLDKRLRAIDAAPTLQTFKGSKQLTGQRDTKGNFHELKGNRNGQIACSLDSGDRLIMTPNHSPLHVDRNGNLDWSKVTSVTIEEVATDYHRKPQKR